ncbi:decorin-binding protein DbpB [Borreliella turdi]|uniref:decorin-binding protein DbpB n=1 Tax=Borreliella turdi TaxID=57863 RepID=UPI001243ABD3|nr:decorin-binding protein DbpB [Borreliella turdi]
MKKFNLIIVSLFIVLFVACNFGLTGKVKAVLESSSADVKSKISQIKEEAAKKGVNFVAFTDTATGSKVTSGGLALREAKVQAIGEVKKFLKIIEEEALKLKGHGNSSQFLAMFNLMLEVTASLDAIGIKGVKTYILEEAECSPVNTADRLVEVKAKIENKLEGVKKRQKLDDGDKKINKSKNKK